MSTKGGFWTEAEAEFLRSNIDQTPAKLLQQLPGRSYKAIEIKLWKLRNSLQAERGDSAQLLKDVLSFCQQRSILDTDFGSRAVNSPSFVASLKAGRTVSKTTEERVRSFMAEGDSRPSSRGHRTARAYASAKARNMRAEHQAAAFRLSDPVEQAKTAIRRAGFACFEAEITNPKAHGKFFIGARMVTKEELFERARRHGWTEEGE